jgi:DNA-binding NtrC family response regulator
MIESGKRSTAGSVLVVDDHPAARESMAYILSEAGYRVDSRSSAREALELLARTAPDVVITDLRMPGMSGMEFIAELRRRHVAAQIVMVTAHATVSSAVDAMRNGAYDYIEKPFDAEQLEQLVGRALRHGQSDAGRETERPPAGGSAVHLIGEGPVMRGLRARLAQVAPTRETVLITGESGTGKELVARTLHAWSDRRDAPLVSLNCPALSPQLLESELFGHERGAFTGADAARAGRFEVADGGTILLDEVTEIALPLQAKLLRVLQEQTFERVGSNQPKRTNVRVLATSNRDLRTAVQRGEFRQDLYFRLAVVPLHVAPLRERGEDIGRLAEHFVAQAARRLGRRPPRLAEDAERLLRQYHWPGNVRELENLMTRACVLHDQSLLAASDLRPWLMEPAAIGATTPSAPAAADRIPVGMSLQDMERRMIEATLERFGSHRGKAAKTLGIGVRTLANKLRAYGYAPRARQFSPSD